MNILLRRSLFVCLPIAAFGASVASFALPTNVTVTPPNGARFLPGQRFDLRVEGQGAGPFSATIFIDSVQKQFTSGAQNTTTTDGITASDIPVSAYSTSRTGREPWRSFGGVQENTDVFFKIMRAIMGGY